MRRQSLLASPGELTLPFRRRPLPDISASLGLLDATFFLYHSYEDAEQGTAAGGAGVVVGVPLTSRPELHVRYAVSNWHTVCKAGASVVRLGLPDGKTHIFEADPSEWTWLPGKQDLAAIPLRLPPDIRPAVIPTALFVGIGEKSDVHVGDDVFMVGRFIDFDGHDTNKPATRFGHVSMLEAPIRQETGWSGPSVIVDMHSRSGFSGSPVYVYRPGMTMQMPFTIENPDNAIPSLGKDTRTISHRKWGMGNNVNVRLLGVHWGQFPEMWEIRSGKAASSEAHLVTEGSYVAGLSGMTCVVPADQILELLNCPELAAVRQALERPGSTDGIPPGE